MKKHIVAAIVTALFLFTVLWAAAETMTCIVPEGQYVNVRQKARADASTLGETRNGDTIDAVSVSDGWVEFDYDGKTAYAMVKYFEIEAGSDFVIMANGRVRYRDAPNGNALDFYAVGTVVHVDAWRYDKSGNLWGRIGNHFVAAEFLESTNEQ